MMGRALAAALAAASLAACTALPQSPPTAAPPAPVSAPAASPLPSAAPAQNPLAPFGWFAELSGACWKGVYPDNASSDTQCYLAQYQSLMRGTIKGEHTTAGISRTNFEGDAVFAYDPGKGRVLFTQWGWGNTYGTGEILVEGARLVFQNFLSDGSPSKLRSVWTRAGPDGFRVVRERKGDDGAWKEFLAVDYKRVR